MTTKKADASGDKAVEVAPKVYQDRLKLLKKAQEYSAADEIPKAVEHYSQYLNALALFHKVDESKLDPKMFDQERDIAELFLISHAYWDLAKAYDRSPNLHLESIRCLDQFVKFTIGYKFQYVNSRTIKSFIRKRLAHNPKAFKQAYDRIHVESKGCFISTELFGQEHIITNDLRVIKFRIQKNIIGRFFTRLYYDQICPFYFRYESRLFLNTIFKNFIICIHFLFSHLLGFKK
ncbi:MAG: hypothetical protein K9K67_02075 [Bacteriovoracaceae bacterium]|nr:hypothetical protein [Bacteriovoracaceae bacterium]